eukprot:4057943-Pyramimonas_sp.AAC.1
MPDLDWSSVAVILDLWKAFEELRHLHLIDAAVQHDLPVWAVKLQISFYRLPRALELNGAASDLTEVQRT